MGTKLVLSHPHRLSGVIPQVRKLAQNLPWRKPIGAVTTARVYILLYLYFSTFSQVSHYEEKTAKIHSNALVTFLSAIQLAMM